MTRTWTSRLTLAVLLAPFGCSVDDAQFTSFASGSIGSGVGTSDTSSSTTATADTSTSGGESSSSSTGTVDASGSSTSETDSTTGAPAGLGHDASQLVGVGQRMSSTSYTLELTLGQPSQIQSRHTSASYRMQGGLLGANGNTP